MANEATLLFETVHPIPFTVADGTGIEKGACLVLTDPMTAAVALTTSGGAVAGIAASEKIANDGNTKLGVFRGGIFKVYASGSVTAGDGLQLFGNFFQTAGVNAENIAGVALETATNGETFKMELKPFGVNLA